MAKIFRAEDINGAAMFFIQVSRYLGLIPYGYRGQFEYFELYISTTGILFSVATVMAMMGIPSFSETDMIFSAHEVRVSAVVVQFVCVLNVCCRAVSLLNFLRRCSTLNQLLKGLVRLDSNRLLPDCKWATRQIYLQLSCWALLMGSVCLMGCLREQTRFGQVSACAAFTLFVYGTLVVELQFINLVILLHRHFQHSVNSTLLICCAAGPFLDQVQLHKTFESNKTDGVSRSKERAVKDQGGTLDTQLKVRSFSRLVVSVRENYDNLCDVIEMTNSVYSPILLFNTANSFVTLTYSIYGIFANVMGVESSGSVWSYVHLGVTIGIHASKLFFLAHSCSKCIQEANRTAVLVHKLLNKTRDPEIKEELQLFSLQLLHRKVQFTACGFFPLDFTLLYSIVGAVTTYLVILIQFQLSFVQQHQQQNTTSITTPVPENLSIFFNRDPPLPLVG